MLFLPKRNERGLDPMAQRGQPVDAGVAGGTKGDEKARSMDSRAAMVNGEGTLGPTALAAPAIAGENLVTVTAKAAAGMRLARIAADTPSHGVQLGGATGAEKPGLPKRQGGGGGEGSRPGGGLDFHGGIVSLGSPHETEYKVR